MLMADLPEPPTPTLSAIYASYEARQGDGFRDHLGASLIGKPCARALWYDFRWATPARHTGRILRLFETGQLEEARLVRDLRATDATVLEVDPDTGRQFRVEAHGGHFAAQIHVVEPSEVRRQKALDLGATTATDPMAANAVELIRKATGGVHVAFEVTGVPQVLAQCINATRHEGQTLIVSIWETDAAFQPNTVVLKERQLQGTIAYRNVYPAVMELMTQGYFSAEKLVTRRIPLHDIVGQGFEALAQEKSHVKILVEAPE